MKNHFNKGLTLIELLTTIAITAILLALAAPSFTAFFAKKRVEGLMTELVTDLEFARSEAVQRNTLVQITLGTNCYVIHSLPYGATSASIATSCTQAAGSTIGSGETEIKTVKVATGFSATFSPAAGTIIFDPVRGMATISSGTETIKTTSSTGAWELRANITPTGRVKICSPSGSGNITGYHLCS